MLCLTSYNQLTNILGLPKCPSHKTRSLSFGACAARRRCDSNTGVRPYLEENMKKDEMTTTGTWVAPTRFPVSPAISPVNMQEDELILTRDKHYGLHGEILMLVLVISFSLFLVMLVALPYLKRSSRDSESGVVDSPSLEQRNCSFPWLGKSRRADGDSPGERQLQFSNEISRNLPL